LKVVKDNLELNTRKFKINETIFSIVGTILNDGTHDTVVNMNNGKVKKYLRLDLKEMTEKYNAIGL
jgi:ureidoglycolate hydrolase